MIGATYTPHVGPAGMLLHINGKFTMKVIPKTRLAH